MNPKEIAGVFLPGILLIILFFVGYKKTIDFSQTVFGKLVLLCIVLFYAEMNLLYGFLALVFVVFFYKIFGLVDNDRKVTSVIDTNQGNSLGLVTKARVEVDEPPMVPLILYQTWHSKQLPPKMTACVSKLKRDNPEFEHRLYDDADCRAFIKDNFTEDVLDAYDRLIPGAYKADLWRYCVLYVTGGVYLDIKFQCEPGLMELTKEPETFVLDRPYANMSIPLDTELAILNSPTFTETIIKNTEKGLWKNDQIGLYNAVMASIPNNPILYDCIQQVVRNVKKEYYGFNPLYPTGPGLLSEIYFKNEYRTKLKNMRYFNSVVGTYILNRERKALSQYPEYRREQRANPPKGPLYYYSDLWYRQEAYIITTVSRQMKYTN